MSVDPTTLNPGDRLLWEHEMRGGYGYVEMLGAEVVKVGKTRVCIRVHKYDGTAVERWVGPEHLVDPAPIRGGIAATQLRQALAADQPKEGKG